ncbi:MAG: hypothetical protein A2289_05160 [Deltaproteobacteria bacterium RIFOXYA12_FULL_58_15]|nr:MAG: hypothetical protein A2289_05160 [Deltaproteobacteria bacterium RIFOXYA12_FULL_58_15]OGR08565.1 MAG: hypothetical protein A2341_25495 [Deltaproteobacteria bacterium RIFOXYB12_FULL_58_9]
MHKSTLIVVCAANLFACTQEDPPNPYQTMCTWGTGGCNCNRDGTCNPGLDCIDRRCMASGDYDSRSDGGGDSMTGDTRIGDSMTGDTRVGDSMTGDTRVGDTTVGDSFVCPSFFGLVVINELLPNEPGSDAETSHSFVELRGVPGTDLKGLRMEHFNGNGGVRLFELPLSGVIPSDGYYVMGESGVPNLDQPMIEMDLQNGPDNLRLVDCLDRVVDAVGYGSFGATDVFIGEGMAAIVPAEGQTVGRCFATHFTDSDSNDNGSDFQAYVAPAVGNDYSAIAGLPNSSCF